MIFHLPLPLYNVLQVLLPLEKNTNNQKVFWVVVIILV